MVKTDLMTAALALAVFDLAVLPAGPGFAAQASNTRYRQVR
jgi:hypothetical protein